MKQSALFALCGLLLGITCTSHALTVTSIDGTWSGVAGGPYVNNDGVTVAYGNTIEDQIRWGIPDVIPSDPTASDVNRKSGLGFAGAAGSTFADGSIFEIGQITHYNAWVWPPLSPRRQTWA